MSSSALVNQIVLLILDDVRSSHLFGLINDGTLPNMEALMENGISCRNCITSYPAITFPCYPNIITGAYSGYYPIEGSGIPAYHWVNRQEDISVKQRYPFIRNYSYASHIRKIDKDLGSNVQTIFEQVPDGNLLSVFNFISRGSKFNPLTDFSPEYLFKSLVEVYKNPKSTFDTKEVPVISVVYLPKTDSLMHDQGFDSEDYINEILKCDNLLGGLVNSLKEMNYFESTAICIISDHGNYKAQQTYDLEPYFNNLGFTQYDPKKKKGDFDVAFGSVGTFNFRGSSWFEHPTIEQMRNFRLDNNKKINLFKVLWGIPGVKLMYYRDDSNTPNQGKIHLEGFDANSGEKLKATIEYQGHGKDQTTKYTYENSDLFGYDKNPSSASILNGKFHKIDEWLENTYEGDFPVFVDLLPRYFKNSRSCDILISTLGEYCFNYEHGRTANDHLYSHDVALKKSMTVPFIIGGSQNIPRKEVKYCKTTDMVPTLLRLLNITPHSSVVGSSLI